MERQYAVTADGGKNGSTENKRGRYTMAIAAALAAALLLAGCSSNNNGDSQSDDSAANSAATSSRNTADHSSGGAGEKYDGDTAASNSGGSSGAKDDYAAAPESGAPAGTSSRSESAPAPKPQQQPEPQSGMLTAGEWNDLAHWSDWGKLLNRQEGEDNLDYWRFARFDRLDVEVTGGGKPAVDADVSVKDEDGQTVWEARTDVSGKAAAFAGLFDSQHSQDSYLVEVEAGGEVKRFENVPIPRGKTLRIELDGEAPQPDALDVMLVVDTTGSMGDELKYLQTELEDVITRVKRDNGQKLKVRMSPNFYRDTGDDYVVRPFPFTADVSKVKEELAEQRASGGDDYPEAVDQALDNAIHEHEWSGEARARLMFLVLDAPPHHSDRIVKRMHELTQEAAEAGIRIVPVASSGVDANTEYLMRFMAAATGGTYLFLTDHSGIGGDHKEAEVGEYEVKALNDLLVEVINRYCGYPQTSGNG